MWASATARCTPGISIAVTNASAGSALSEPCFPIGLSQIGEADAFLLDSFFVSVRLRFITECIPTSRRGGDKQKDCSLSRDERFFDRDRNFSGGTWF
jgi:hypothetical protein